jgi:hypothetical protein
MPIDRVVVNASPLIALFRSGQAELLGQLWPEVALCRGQCGRRCWLEVRKILLPVVFLWSRGRNK